MSSLEVACSWPGGSLRPPHLGKRGPVGNLRVLCSSAATTCLACRGSPCSTTPSPPSVPPGALVCPTPTAPP
eukprot:2244104-Rhodomonas_salina.1